MVGEDQEKMNDAALVASVEECIDQLKGYRVAAFPPFEQRPGSKLVHLAAVWRSTLAYRLVDLADAALDMFKGGRLVPGCTLTRSVMETVAAVHLLRKRISAVETVEKLEEVLVFLLQATFGSRDGSTNYDALNVLTLIGHLDKQYKFCQDEYDHLSEYAHPNLKGGFMAYTKIDKETFSAELGLNPAGVPLGSFGLGGLDLILQVALDEFKTMEEAVEGYEDAVFRLSLGVFVD